jgi:hypothetical protein
MDNATLFYITGGVLAASAVVVSFLGLRLEKFPGKAAPLVAVWFVILIGTATTFSVLASQDEEHHREQELHHASEEAEAEEEEALEAE